MEDNGESAVFVCSCFLFLRTLLQSMLLTEQSNQCHSAVTAASDDGTSTMALLMLTIMQTDRQEKKFMYTFKHTLVARLQLHTHRELLSSIAGTAF